MNQVTFEEVYANAYIRESITVILTNTIRKYPMLKDQVDDINQELLLALNKNISKFNPQIGTLEYFFRMVLDLKIKKILRAFFAEKEVRNRTCDHYDNHEFIIDTISFDDVASSYPLEIDVKEVIAKMSRTNREICYLLMKGFSKLGVMQKLNISNESFYRVHLPKIRQNFVEAKVFLRNF